MHHLFNLTPLFSSLTGNWHYSIDRISVHMAPTTLPMHIHVDAEIGLSETIKPKKSGPPRPPYLSSDRIQQSIIKMTNGNKCFSRQPWEKPSNEYDRYISRPLMTYAIPVLHWWRQNDSGYPKLSLMVLYTLLFQPAIQPLR